jgi:hypothetical protein
MSYETTTDTGAQRPVFLQIGEVILRLNTNTHEKADSCDDHCAFEIASECHDIELRVNRAPRLTKAGGKRVFDSGGLWILHAAEQGYVFDFFTPMLGPVPYKKLMVSADFSQAHLLLSQHYVSANTPIYPFEYPVDELLIINWLARGRGIEIHGCGLVDSEAGANLLIGHSGAGKSTTAKLWKSQRNAHILSDERLILRKQAGKIWMHGTPWHGEAGFASPDKAPLRNIFILEHGEENEIIPLSQPRAVAELFTRCFVPFHDPDLLQFALSFLQDVTSLVPCYLYRFLPNSSAVETILEFQSSG